jgi:hypothetical protein
LHPAVVAKIKYSLLLLLLQADAVSQPPQPVGWPPQSSNLPLVPYQDTNSGFTVSSLAGGRTL